MPNRFTEIIHTSYGNRVTNSIKGVLLGIVFIVLSVGTLYWNEGRINLSSLAKTAIEIDAKKQNTDPSLNGKLVSSSGVVSSDQVMGDNLFLKSGKFIVVERKVEMFAWVEKNDSKSTTEVGGSETTQKTQNYVKEWTEYPPSPSNFSHPEGHANSQKTLDNDIIRAADATIGVYHFDVQSIVIPSVSKLPLNSQNVNLSQGITLANDTYLFMKKNDNGSFENPQIGDYRISYNVLSSGFDGTIFGQLKDNKITPYFDQDGKQLYRLFIGTRDSAIATLQDEYASLLWVIRIGGFLLLWIGFNAILGPLSTLLDVVPLVGALSRSIMGVIIFFISLMLTLITIIISSILHNLVALMISLAIIIIALMVSLKIWKKKRAIA